MRWLSDEGVAHLREVVEQPDLSNSRYDLVREIGRGGMGVVYEARDMPLDRTVAMKVMDAEWHGEATIIAALEHPGIVPVHDAGTLADGRFFYTMKLVRGMRLDAWSAQTHPITERVRLFARVCEPVAFAHARGVVHRDLKPENVMVGEFGAVLVMDWGVASIAGTAGYMPPEETRDARSDVYSLGAILSFLLRGETIPRPLRSIISRATADGRSERYASARELGDDVVRCLDAERVLAHRENVYERIVRWASKYRTLIAIVVAYLVMRVILFLWVTV